MSLLSLLHLDKNNLKNVLINLMNSLKKDGILYVSMKDGVCEEIDKVGRYFNYIDKDNFISLVCSSGLELVDFMCTKSVINLSEIKNWNNFILRRKYGII